MQQRQQLLVNPKSFIQQQLQLATCTVLLLLRDAIVAAKAAEAKPHQHM
jgi:hypothetical protein